MTHASLFSGIGGSEVAATMLGWENLFYCEINEFGRKVLDYWYPKSKSYEDITKTDFSEWRGKVDVLTGGFPCQPFSYAGKRRGADDDRYLWPFMFKAIDQIRPTWIVAENVAGITTMVEQGEVFEMGGQASLFEEVDGLRRYRLAETFTLQRICDDLEGHGYAVQPVLVPACAVGASHRRDRVFIVARRKEESAAADSVGSGERTSRPSGEPESIRGDTHQQPSERRAETERLDRLHAVLRHATDTCNRGRPMGGITEGCRQHDSDGSAEYSCRRWIEMSNNPPRTTEDERRGTGEAERTSDGYEVGRRWQNFPSISPVHRGNDGIPFDVDSLSIPFAKWRTESLKAYGNAIVPQVMYEIFRAIELVENQLF